jgi:hypothetical protein
MLLLLLLFLSVRRSEVRSFKKEIEKTARKMERVRPMMTMKIRSFRSGRRKNSNSNYKLSYLQFRPQQQQQQQQQNIL